jgi:hypothetical protein
MKKTYAPGVPASACKPPIKAMQGTKEVPTTGLYKAISGKKK